MVFCCGGIGATPDDHTRQCAAAALGVPLVLHPEAATLIVERMRDVAAEQGVPFEPDRADNVHRLNMGVFPHGAAMIPNPYNKIPGFSVWRSVHFVPGFPVMAWPMIEWVLDHHYARRCQRLRTQAEQSVIVLGAMEATLTPLMEAHRARAMPASRSSACPASTTRRTGRHIELGVKGAPARSWTAPCRAACTGWQALDAQPWPRIGALSGLTHQMGAIARYEVHVRRFSVGQS